MLHLDDAAAVVEPPVGVVGTPAVPLLHQNQTVPIDMTERPEVCPPHSADVRQNIDCPADGAVFYQMLPALAVCFLHHCCNHQNYCTNSLKATSF